MKYILEHKFNGKLRLINSVRNPYKISFIILIYKISNNICLQPNRFS